MRMIAAICAVLAPAASLAAPAGAATIHVNCAKANLQTKIDNAAPGSTLLVKGTCAGQFMVGKRLTLEGNPKATLDAVAQGRPLTITGTPTVHLIDLTITGGLVERDAGGILHPGGALTLKRVAVVGNLATAAGPTTGSAAASGGGISSGGGSLTLIRSSVRRNTAKAAGGVAVAAGGGIVRAGSLTLVRSTVAANRAIADSSGTAARTFGGGIYVVAAAVSVTASHVDGNRAIADAPGGPSLAQGGGIFLDNTDALTIRRSTLRGNRAAASTGGTSATGRGGGIAGALESRTIAIRNTAISGNSVRAESDRDATAAGGGVGVDSGVSMRASRIASNGVEAVGGDGIASASGGGLEVNDVLKLRNGTVARNTVNALSGSNSEAGGGGIDVAGELVMRASTVSRNVASAGGQSLGGGVSLPTAPAASITNSTIAENRASGTTARGGGIDTFAIATVTNSTVARNKAKLGGGIYVEQGTTTLAATIVAGNTAPGSADCVGPLSAGRNLIGTTHGCMFVPKPSDKLNTAPRLGKLGPHGGPTQTIPLLERSPALDAIPKAACAVGRDQRGVKRPQGRRCDIGAFERKH